ncbi:peptidoglycan/xylan/chitin deacetylase (PgdA/CDA1 family) [Rossellomorea marisflavi]
MMMKSLFASGFLALLFSIFAGIFLYLTELRLPEPVTTASADSNIRIDACAKEPRTFTGSTRNDGTVPILTYHRIVEENDLSSKHMIDGKVNQMIVTKEEFEKQIAFLKEEGFTSLTLPELHEFLVNKQEIPKKSVVITFDDGYKDNVVEAYPVLKKSGFQATSFLIAGMITAEDRPFTPEFVQYANMGELASACSVFSYYSHTFDFHHRKGSTTKDEKSFLITEDAGAIRKDLAKSIGVLKGESLAFAYPYGEYSPKSIRILKDLGIAMAFTTEERDASQANHLYELPRHSVFHDTTMTRFQSIFKPHH